MCCSVGPATQAKNQSGLLEGVGAMLARVALEGVGRRTFPTKRRHFSHLDEFGKSMGKSSARQGSFRSGAIADSSLSKINTRK